MLPPIEPLRSLLIAGFIFIALAGVTFFSTIYYGAKLLSELKKKSPSIYNELKNAPPYAWASYLSQGNDSEDEVVKLFKVKLSSAYKYAIVFFLLGVASFVLGPVITFEVLGK